MYSFSRKFGLSYYVTEDQHEQLTYYFEPERLGLSVLERDLGDALPRLKWIKPWDRIDYVDDNFNYDKISDKELHRGRAIDIGDYPNEVQHFAQYLPDIRRMFRLRERFRSRAAKTLEVELTHRNIDWTEVTWVGVHNRRGDYGQHLTALYGLDLLEPDYFYRAMQRFNSEYNNVIFILVTDDMEWAESNLMFPGLQVVFAGHKEVLEKDVRHPLATADDIGDDLALLAACNHTILSYGTFGQWGALLAGGKVVISDTAGNTKEGRELQEAGLAKHNSGWRWMAASLNSSADLVSLTLGLILGPLLCLETLILMV